LGASLVHPCHFGLFYIENNFFLLICKTKGSRRENQNN
jgi:hypothetical protein